MRVIGYVRVSTDKQADDGLGLDVQRQAIRRWAKANGHRVVTVHADEGVSGSTDVSQRVGLTAALSEIADGKAHGLVVHRLDRLARSLVVQEAALAQVWKVGGRVFATDHGEVMADDPDDPMRTAMRQMMGVFAQLERGMISTRLTAARRLKASRGGYAGGRPAYGYRADQKELAHDLDEQAAIRRIRQLHKQGRSLREIAAVLTAEGHRPKRSDRWHPYTVAQIVKRAAA